VLGGWYINTKNGKVFQNNSPRLDSLINSLHCEWLVEVCVFQVHSPVACIHLGKTIGKRLVVQVPVEVRCVAPHVCLVRVVGFTSVSRTLIGHSNITTLSSRAVRLLCPLVLHHHIRMTLDWVCLWQVVVPRKG
jgi:hypothetical protein